MMLYFLYLEHRKTGYFILIRSKDLRPLLGKKARNYMRKKQSLLSKYSELIFEYRNKKKILREILSFYEKYCQHLSFILIHTKSGN